MWPMDKLVAYSRNPRKNAAAIDRMSASIREFGLKIPCLVPSDGEVVDGHLRLKAARKLGITEIPVILCDEWTPAQVKAFRPMVNRSVTWADWDEELLALELQEIQESDFDLSLTGFDPCCSRDNIGDVILLKEALRLQGITAQITHIDNVERLKSFGVKTPAAGTRYRLYSPCIKPG